MKERWRIVQIIMKRSWYVCNKCQRLIAVIIKCIAGISSYCSVSYLQLWSSKYYQMEESHIKRSGMLLRKFESTPKWDQIAAFHHEYPKWGNPHWPFLIEVPPWEIFTPCRNKCMIVQLIERLMQGLHYVVNHE